MKVCFFGSYENESFGIPSGNGGILLKTILEKKNIQVIECHEPLKKYRSIVISYLKLLHKHKNLEYDVMLIPWRGVLTLPLAKLVHKRQIIYFPAFSLYDTFILDRKKYGKNSLQAKIFLLVDKIACRWSDIVILESTEEIKFFINELHCSPDKFIQLPLAVDESIFFPRPITADNKKFIVFALGKFF